MDLSALEPRQADGTKSVVPNTLGLGPRACLASGNYLDAAAIAALICGRVK